MDLYARICDKLSHSVSSLKRFKRRTKRETNSPTVSFPTGDFNDSIGCKHIHGLWKILFFKSGDFKESISWNIFRVVSLKFTNVSKDAMPPFSVSKSILVPQKAESFR